MAVCYGRPLEISLSESAELMMTEPLLWHNSFFAHPSSGPDHTFWQALTGLQTFFFFLHHRSRHSSSILYYLPFYIVIFYSNWGLYTTTIIYPITHTFTHLLYTWGPFLTFSDTLTLWLMHLGQGMPTFQLLDYHSTSWATDASHNNNNLYNYYHTCSCKHLLHLTDQMLGSTFFFAPSFNFLPVKKGWPELSTTKYEVLSTTASSQDLYVSDIT